MNTTRLTLTFFWKYIRRHPKWFALGFLNVIQNSINGAFSPLLIGIATAKLANPSSTSLSYETIFLIIVCLSVVGILVNRVSLDAINKYKFAGSEAISNDIAKHLVHETYDFHSKNFSGAIINKATKLTGSFIDFVDTVALDSLRNFTIVVFSLGTLFFYDIRLASIILFMACLGWFASVYLTKRYYPLQKNAVKKASDQTAYLSDLVTNAITVKTFAAEASEVTGYSKLSRKLRNARYLAGSRNIDGNSTRMSIMIAMNLAVLAYGVYAIQNGSLSLSIFIAAQIYCTRISGSFWELNGITRNLERIFADAHEMITILNPPLQLADKKNAGELAVSKGEVSFNNVSFSYPDAEKPVFQNLSILIKPGEKVGLVGKSGGGKTTITKLVLRFMDVSSGTIQIDGQNIAEVTQDSLRHEVSYVPQEPLLFHRTLAENIGYSKSDATIKEITEASQLAYAHEFIKDLPKGYNTLVGERGIKLSGGQRQRVAIARAILKNSPILLLDEATSALDSESEVVIQKALWKLMEGRTAIVIAHRLSTIQKMDRIIVLDKGRVIEEGSHSELLAKNGTYAELWAHQSGGFIEE